MVDHWCACPCTLSQKWAMHMHMQSKQQVIAG